MSRAALALAAEITLGATALAFLFAFAAIGGLPS